MIKLSLTKRIIYYAALFCGVIASIEPMALAAYWIAFHKPFSYRELQTSRLAQLRSTTEGTSILDGRASWLTSWAIHPYYGFIHNPGSNRLVKKFRA